MITEGKAKLDLQGPKKISKDMGVFYNPVMKVNRDISIMLLNSLLKKDMRIADPMAGSGIRSIRFALELKDKHRLSVNDISDDSVKKIKENMVLNSVDFPVFNQDANVFLMEKGPWDYIDIDPFGPPTKFLNSAVRSIFRDGIIAVTATDTSCLSGTYPKACLRKYWARPLRNELMHEIGLRILIRKVQLIGSQYDKALIPIYSFSTDHYFRVFLRAEPGKRATDYILKQHGYLLHCNCRNQISNHPFNEDKCPDCGGKRDFAGPLWTGRLWDKKIAKKISESAIESKDAFRMAEIISEESAIDIPFFYDVHRIWKSFKIKNQKKMDDIISEIRKKGFRAERTHFSMYGIRTDAEKIIGFIR